VATTGPNVRPGEKPPVRPELATRNSPAGAAEFARYWFAALDWGYATTDSTLAKSLFASSCTGCARFMRNILDYTRDHHRHFVGGRLAVVGVAVRTNDHHAHASAVLDVTVVQTALKVVDASGEVVGRAPAVDHGSFRTWLRWDGDQWVVADWKQAVTK
jgi:hypothetical protein